MFNLVLSIATIALIAILALAAVYYGGTAISNSTATAKAGQIMNQIEQIGGALQLATSNGLTVPNGTPLDGSASDVLTQNGYFSTQMTTDLDPTAAWVVGNLGATAFIAVKSSNDATASQACIDVDVKGGNPTPANGLPRQQSATNGFVSPSDFNPGGSTADTQFGCFQLVGQLASGDDLSVGSYAPEVDQGSNLRDLVFYYKLPTFVAAAAPQNDGGDNSGNTFTGGRPVCSGDDGLTSSDAGSTTCGQNGQKAGQTSIYYCVYQQSQYTQPSDTCVYLQCNCQVIQLPM